MLGRGFEAYAIAKSRASAVLSQKQVGLSRAVHKLEQGDVQNLRGPSELHGSDVLRGQD